MKRKATMTVYTKGLAVLLTAGLLVSSMPGSQTGAKAKTPKLSTTKVTVKVGKTKKVTVKNAKKVTWTLSKKAKKIVKLTKKSKKGATIRGLKKGTAKISVKMKAGKKTVKKTITVKVQNASSDDGEKNNTTPKATDNTGLNGATSTPTPAGVVETPTPAPTEGEATPTPTQGTPKPTKVPKPTDLPADLVPARATSAPGTHATAGLPLMYTDVPDLDYIRVGDDYYMVSTTMFLNPGVPIMHSTDLVHWEIISYVYDTLEDNDTTNLKNGKQCYGRGSWAASLRYNEADETYYVCFSSNDQNKTYIYTTKDIAGGEWEKHSANGTRHDPGLIFDDGKMYIISGNGNISIQEAELSGDKIEFKGSSKTILQKASTSNIVSIEGCHAYKIGDYYYLFFIEWPKNGKRMEWCFRSTSLTGEWEGKVVFCDDGKYNGAGIAQGGIVDTKYGDWYAILFQDHGAVGRVPVLLDVYWVDNWPIMGSDNGKASASNALDVNLTSDGKDYIYADDDFSYTENKLQLVWQWNHNPDNENWSVTEREGYLRLTTGSLATSIKDARNSLTQRTYGPTCTSEAGIDVSNMKAGDYAGLCAFQTSYGQVGVMKDEDGKTWIYYGSGKDTMTVKDADKIALNQDTVSLQIKYNFNNNTATFYYSLDGKKWVQIGGSLSMSYDLTVFMGYRTYLYNYATTQTGGYVDFDYYKIYD